MDYDYQKGFEEGYRMIMGASALLTFSTYSTIDTAWKHSI